MKYFLGIKNENDLISTKLINLGYKWVNEKYNDNMWIYIVVTKDTIYKYGCLVGGTFNKSSDASFFIEININDVPKRKDLDEYVKFLKESKKMRLL